MEEYNEQQFNLQDYIRILYRGRWIITFSFIVVVTATVYWTFTTHKVYESTSLILLKEEGGMQRQIFEVPTFMKKETMINNHVEILQSYSLAEEVIKRLQASKYSDSLYILGTRKLKERFSIQSFLNNVSGRQKEPEEDPSLEDLAEGLRESMISVVPRRDTDLVELKVNAFSPFEAAFIANTWMEAYRDMDIQASSGEVSRVREFLERKLKDIKDELTVSENALKDYKESTKVAELGSETEQLINQSAQFEGLYQEAKTDLESNVQRLNHLKSQLNESQRVLIDEATGLSTPVIQQLQQQMANEMAAKAAYEQQLRSADLYSPDDSRLQRMESRLKGLQESISKEMEKMVSSGGAGMNPLDISQNLLANILQIEAENKSLRARTDALKKIVGQYERSLNSLPEKSLRLARLKRDAEVKNNLYLMLNEKYEENRIVEAGQIGSVRIVDWAKPPKFPIKPKKKMNLLLGIMMGLGLGVGITFLREYMDATLKTIEDVERLGFAVLGSIPFISPQKLSKNGAKDGDVTRIESRLVTHFAPKSPISESYRTLRTNIQYANVDHPTQLVVVTSSGPGEGKSTSVANLAITFAQMGAKTLLIDTDLRRPVLHGIFGHSRNEGLTNVLVGRLKLEEAIKQTRIDDLDLLTSGTLPPNPSELLNSHMMETFLENVKQKYDIILLDTPPVIAVTDAAVLATKVDGVVLVMRSAATMKEVLIRSQMLLNKVNAKLLGILVNGVNTANMYGSYYQYYEYYYASDGRQKKGKKKLPKVKV